MSAGDPREKRFAEAVAVLVEAIHHDVPTASTRPLAPYDDEDFTLEVRIPAGMARDTVMDLCMRHALAIEDQCGLLILTRVKVAEAAEASACAALSGGTRQRPSARMEHAEGDLTNRRIIL